jgi:hypothetical protein
MPRRLIVSAAHRTRRRPWSAAWSGRVAAPRGLFVTLCACRDAAIPLRGAPASPRASWTSHVTPTSEGQALLGSDQRGVLRELIEAAAHSGNVHPRRLPDVDAGGPACGWPRGRCSSVMRVVGTTGTPKSCGAVAWSGWPTRYGPVESLASRKPVDDQSFRCITTVSGSMNNRLGSWPRPPHRGRCPRCNRLDAPVAVRPTKSGPPPSR